MFGRYKPPRSSRALRPRPIKFAGPKNIAKAAENRQLAMAALAEGACLSFTYHRLPRVAEVHTVGITTAGRPAMSVFQVDGESDTPPIPDWRLFCFDECFNVALTDIPSLAPRPEYKKGAKQFRIIDAEI